MATSVKVFDTRFAASQAAAVNIGSTIIESLENHEYASVIVSGGSTPVDCFHALSQMSLDWSKVQLLLSDERWVDSAHDASNEAMLRRQLVVDEALPANIVSIFTEQATVEQGVERLDQKLTTLARPFSIALLGMGEDGHFASLFPDANNLEQGMSLESDAPSCLAVTTAASDQQRISLSLKTLVDSQNVLLLAFGNKKKSVFDQALAGDKRYPLWHLLHQSQADVTLYWAE